MTAASTVRLDSPTSELVYLPAIRSAANDAAPAAAAGTPGRRVRLFGLSITDTSLQGAARWLVSRAVCRQTTSVGFINAHCVNVAYHDGAYRAAVEALDVIFADGAGVGLVAKATGQPLTENVNGTDLFPVLCREAAAAGASLYLLGGGEGVAGRAGDAMASAVRGLDIAGSRAGYFDSPEAEMEAIDAINRSGASILLVGLGVPLQEQWIARNRSRLEVPVVIGVGGLFDYFSGRIPRAPLLLRQLGLEWTWRLAMEPKRLARRYLLGNIEFLARFALLRLLAPTTLAGSSGR